MAKKNDNNNGRFIKLSVATALTIVTSMMVFLFGYGIARIDKNTDNIMAIKENYVTKSDLKELEKKIDELIYLQKRR